VSYRAVFCGELQPLQLLESHHAQDPDGVARQEREAPDEGRPLSEPAAGPQPAEHEPRHRDQPGHEASYRKDIPIHSSLSSICR
jgi:hypothetical protein